MNITHVFDSTVATRSLPELRPGLIVKIHQKIKEGTKSRTQIFEGIIIAHKHGVGPNGTITVRKVTDGIGVERVFPLHLPTIEKFEVVRTNKVRRAKLYYLREKSERETRRKLKAIATKAKTITKESITEATAEPTE